MTDEPLLRNTSGIATDRVAEQPVESRALELAIGGNVRRLRAQTGLSIADMADRIGISKAMLSKIENAQTSCSLNTLSLLAAGLDVPVTSLFRGADVEQQVPGTGGQPFGQFMIVHRPFSNRSTTICARSSGWRSGVSRRSGFFGRWYGLSIPVKCVISPARALA